MFPWNRRNQQSTREQVTGPVEKMAIRLTFILGLLLTAQVGCGTTAQRGAMDQLLVSDAIDQAVGQIDFSPLQGREVYLDGEYIRTVKTHGFVNADYVLSSLRHQILAAGCHLKDRRDDAEIVIEPRVGSLGTDDYNIVYGIPRSEAAAVLGAASSTGFALPVVPELAVGKSEYRQGFAKLNVFAYRASDRSAVWQSGTAKSTTSSRDTWVMGIGPFQKGSIYRDKQLGGFNRLANVWAAPYVPPDIPPYLLAQTYPNTEATLDPAPVAAQSSDVPPSDSSPPSAGTIGDSPAPPQRR
jgi:hypothetical protein